MPRHSRGNGPELTSAEQDFFRRERAAYEAKYLAGTTPYHQSGFGRDAGAWERFRRPVVAPIDRDGSFLDIGCANGLLMESVVSWSRAEGHEIAPFGLDFSVELARLAQRRLPHWRDRIFVGNALLWKPPIRFDFVRTELVYVPSSRRHELIERLRSGFLAANGRLMICSYGSTRPEGNRAEPLLDEMTDWGIPIDRVDDVRSPEHGFVITRVVTVSSAAT